MAVRWNLSQPLGQEREGLWIYAISTVAVLAVLAMYLGIDSDLPPPADRQQLRVCVYLQPWNRLSGDMTAQLACKDVFVFDSCLIRMFCPTQDFEAAIFNIFYIFGSMETCNVLA